LNIYFWKKQEHELIHKIDYIKNKHNKNIEPIKHVHYVNKNLDFALVSSSKENIYSINTRSGKILKKFK
jgi:ribosomal protein S8